VQPITRELNVRLEGMEALAAQVSGNTRFLRARTLDFQVRR
jgi:hypothetical protein